MINQGVCKGGQVDDVLSRRVIAYREELAFPPVRQMTY